MPDIALADLLRADPNGLVLDSATIATTATTATVSGRANVAGLGEETVTVTFSVAGTQLAAAMAITLSAITLRQLAAAGWLPASTYAAAALPDVTFSAVQLTIDRAARMITLNATGPSGALGLGLAALPLSAATLRLLLYVPDGGAVQVVDAHLNANLAIGAGLPVRLDLPRGLEDWKLRLTSAGPSALSGGLGDLTALAGRDLAPVLPAGFGGSSAFTLTQLAVRFSTDSAAPGITGLDLAVRAAGDWTVIPSALAITSASAVLHVAFPGGGVTPLVTGTIGGTFTLFGSAIELTIPVPAGGDAWLLEARPQLAVPGIGTLVSDAAALVGAGDLSTVLPAGLADLGAFTVTALRIAFNPLQRTILSTSFSLAADAAWTLPYASAVSLDDLRVELSIANPLDAAQRSVTGFVAGGLTLGTVTVPVVIARPAGASSWTLSIAYDTIDIGLPDAVALAGVSPADFRAALPGSLSIVSDLSLTMLNVVYDLSANQLQEVALSVTLHDPWDAVPGLLRISAADATVRVYDPALSASRQTVGSIGATVAVAGAEFVLGGVYGGSGDWVLSGAMAPGASLSLNDVIAWLAGLLVGGVTLPTSFPQVTATAATLELDTSTGRVQGALTSQVAWALPFAGHTLQIANLATTLAVDPAPTAGGPRPYRFTATGGLQIGDALHCAVSFSTSSATDPTVLQATLAADEVSALSLSGVADTFTAAGTWAQSPKPSGFTPPALSGAGLYLNATDEVLIVHGQAAGYGLAALLVQRFPPAVAGGERTWGFAFAFALAPGAKLGDLFAPLAAVDSVLSFEQANLVLVSLPSQAPGDGSTSLFSALSAVDGVPALPLAHSAGSGLNFYAKLTLNAPLLKNVAFIVAGLDSATVTLSAHVGGDPAGTLFTASLAHLRIAQFVAVDVLELQYRPNAAGTTPQLDLACSGSVGLPAQTSSGAATQVGFAFSGRLTVTDKTALFVADVGSGGGSAISPLGIPGITFTGLRLAIAARFDPPPKTIDCAIEADVTIGSSQGLTGRILFADGTPAVAAVELAQAGDGLPMSQLFAQSVHTQNWQSDLLPQVTFQSGRVYYAARATTFGSVAYQPGFWVDTQFTIFGRAFSFLGGITPNDGISATGACVAPIDLGFVKLTGPTGSGGPQVRLDATTAKKQLALQFGLDLFGLTFTDGLLSYSKQSGGNPVYAGSITYPHAIAGLGESFTLSAEWSESTGLRITNWPLAPVVQALDMVKALAEAGSGDPCKALGDLGISNDMVQSGFTADVQVESAAQSSSPAVDLAITIGYTIAIKLPGQDPKQIISAQLPSFTVTIPVPTSIAGFAAAIVQAVGSAVPSMVAAVVRDPAALAKLAGALVLSRISDEALSALTCRNVSSDALKQEARNRGRSEGDDGDSNTQKAEDNAGSAEGAGTAAEAAAFAATAETFAVAAIGIFATIIGWFTSLFGVESAEEKEAKAKQARAEAARQRAIDAVKAKLRITNLRLTYAAHGRVRVDWDTLPGAQITYQLSLSSPNGPALSRRLNAAGFDWNDAALVPGRQITATLVASVPKPGGSGFDSYAGDPVGLTVGIPDFGPDGLVVEQVGPALVARWTAGAQSAPSYVVAVQEVGGAALPAPAAGPAGAGFSARVPATQLRIGAAYVVTVTAQPVAGYADPVSTPPITVVALAAPQNLQARYRTGSHALELSWNGVAEAAGFDVQALSGAGLPLAEQAVAAGASTTRLEAAAFVAPAALSVRVGARTAGNAQTVWSEALSVTLADLGTPLAGALEYGSAGLEARWSAVPQALGYEVALSAAPQPLASQPAAQILTAAPPGQPVDPAHPYPLARFAGAVFSSGASLTFTARAVAGVSYSAWSDTTAHATVTLPAIEPTGCRAEAFGPELVVRWQAGPGGSRPYELRVHDGADQPLSASPTIAIDPGGFSARISGAGLVTGSTYIVAVHAVDAGLASAWVSCPPVTLVAPVQLAAPAQPAASILAEVVTVSWTPVANAGSYVVILTPAGVPTPIASANAPAGTTSAVLRLPLATPSGVYVAQVQALPTDARFLPSSWSPGASVTVPARGTYWMVWSSTHGGSALKTAAADGSGVSQLGPQILMPGVLVFDDVSNKIYYGQDFQPGIVGRMNVDGSQPETVIGGQALVRALAVDPVDGYLFWGSIPNWPHGSIQRSDLSGGNVVQIAANQYQPGGLTVDPVAKLIYWIAGGPNDLRVVYSAGLDGSNARIIVQPGSITNGANSPKIDLSGRYLYWVSMSGIVRLLLSGGAPEVVVPGNYASNTGTLAFLPGTDRMYWTDQANGVIYSASSSGSDLKAVLLQLDNPNGIAFVPVRR